MRERKRDRERDRGWSDAIADVKREEGAMSRGTASASRSWSKQGNRFSPRASGKEGGPGRS